MPDWKSLLKKGVDLAQQAKSELEERGIVPPEQARSEPRPAAPARDPREEIAAAIGGDHPNPIDLLHAPEVAAAFGVGPEQVSPPEPYVADGCAGQTWTVRRGDDAIRVDFLLYDGGWSLDELCSSDGARRRPIGDQCLVAPDSGALRRGGESVSVHLSEDRPVDRSGAIEQLLRTVADRLPDFDTYMAKQFPPGAPVLTTLLPTAEVADVLGVALDLPEVSRTDEGTEVRWSSVAPEEDEAAVEAGEWNPPPDVGVRLMQYVEDPMEKQKQMAASGNVWAQMGEKLAESMKEEYAAAFEPKPGPWDEGYLWPTQAYFKKGGRFFRLDVKGLDRDVSEEVAALARRLATRL